MITRNMKSCRLSNAIFTGLFAVLAGTIGFLHCSRDNPFDPNGGGYKPGSSPEAGFLEDSISCFENNPVDVRVWYKDSSAKGGAEPAVSTLLFNWNGNSMSFSDSAAVSGNDSTVTITHEFVSAGNVFTYVWARDNDGLLSLKDSIRVIVKEGKPVISSVNILRDSVLVNELFSIFVPSYNKDSLRTPVKYIWSINTNRDTVTQDSTFKTSFSFPGKQIIRVKVINDVNDTSAVDSITITIVERTDNSGPVIEFKSPASDTVYSSFITVLVQTTDSSGTGVVLIKGVSASSIPGGTVIQMWKRDSIMLNEGLNTIPVEAWDGKFNPTTKSMTVTYVKPDVTPPEITFTSPLLNDTVYLSQATIVVSVIDQSGVAWVKCNSDTMRNQTGSSYSGTAVLTEGKNQIMITAADKKGNTDIDTLVIIYAIRDKTPPTVQITAPLSGQQIPVDSVLVAVAATDSGPNSSGIDTVVINGIAASLKAGNFVRIVSLKHGYDTIRVIATDASAYRNKSKDSVIVVRNISPHFVPDTTTRDTSLVVGFAASIPLCAVDADNDAMTFAFLDNLSKPGKSSTTPRIVSTTPGCVNIVDYTPSTSGLDTFAVKVTDSFSAVDTMRIRVFITLPSATKPYFTTDSNMIPNSATVGVLYTVFLKAEDPKNKQLAYSLGTSPTGAAISGDSGKVTWTPAVADIGKKTFVAYVSNGTESDTIGWSVTVVTQNHPPHLVSPGDKNIDEMALLTFILAGTDQDSDTLIYSFGASSPPGAKLDSASGMFTWTPTYKDAGTYPTVFKVTEKRRLPPLSDSVTVTITVKNINNPPVMVKPHDTTVYELSVLSINLKASDVNGDSIYFEVKGTPPSGAGINGNNFYWPLAASQGGRSYPITFYARDNGVPNLRDSASIIVTVVDATTPVFSTHAAQDTAYAGSTYSFTPMVNDADRDPLVFSKLTGPEGLVVDTNKGEVTWTPTYNQALGSPTYPVSIRAVDHAGNSDTLSWKILAISKWPRVFGDAKSLDTGFCVVQTTDGGYALCGTMTAGVLKVPFFIKTDTLGNPVIFKTYGTNASLHSLQQTTDDGGFIMCGTEYYPDLPSKLLLIKTNGNGETTWTRRLGLTTVPNITESSEIGASVCKTSGGFRGYLACGVTNFLPENGSNTVNQMYVVKVDESGNNKQEWRYGGTSGGNAAGYSIQSTIDNGFIVCGEISQRGGTVGNTDVYLVKAGEKGDTLWTRTYHRTGTSRNVGFSVLQTIDGYIVGGLATSLYGSRGLLLKFWTNGSVSWAGVTSANSAVVSVKAIDPKVGHDFIACGQVLSSSTGMDVLLHRFTSEGIETMAKNLGGPLDDAGYSVFPTNDAGFIVTGFTTPAGSPGNTDIYLVKTNSKGEIVQ